ncbi:flagellar biosynthetic protein FliP, partial [Escherichia coli MS 79-10]
ELKTAFQIGFMIYIPFLVIDLIVASVLMAMGMMMLSPLIVSLPFKLMLFVLIDGWSLTIGTLTTSIRGLGLGVCGKWMIIQLHDLCIHLFTQAALLVH